MQNNKNNKISLIWEKIDSEASVDRPTAREGHVFVHMPDKNQYLLFAGISHTRYADAFIFSSLEKKWTAITPTGEIPKELSYCVGWYDSKKKIKYYFIKKKVLIFFFMVVGTKNLH